LLALLQPQRPRTHRGKEENSPALSGPGRRFASRESSPAQKSSLPALVRRFRSIWPVFIVVVAEGATLGKWRLAPLPRISSLTNRKREQGSGRHYSQPPLERIWVHFLSALLS
ncbi:hypothetical protein AOLI_G00317940, partial [Acnodon oligacanthus]